MDCRTSFHRIRKRCVMDNRIGACRRFCGVPCRFSCFRCFRHFNSSNNSPFSRSTSSTADICSISTRIHTSIPSNGSIHCFRARRAAHIALHLHTALMPLFPVNQVASTAECANAFLDFQNLERIHVAFIQTQFFFQTTDFRIFIDTIIVRTAKRCNSRRNTSISNRRVLQTARARIPSNIFRLSIPSVLRQTK